MFNKIHYLWAYQLLISQFQIPKKKIVMQSREKAKVILPPINNIKNQHEAHDLSMISMEKSSAMNLHCQPCAKNQLKSFDQKYEGVNQIMCWKDQTGDIYYIPAYLRIQVNRVNRIDYIGCVAEVDTFLTLWLMIKQLPTYVQQEIIHNSEFRINGSKGISLKDIVLHKNNSNQSLNVSKKTITFHLKQVLQMEIQTDTFLCPFQVVNLLSTIELRSVTLHQSQICQNSALNQEEKDQFKNATFVFNFMETKTFIQFSFNQLRNLGTFDLAEGMVGIKYSNDDNFGKMKFSVDRAGNFVQEIILPSFIHKKSESSESEKSNLEDSQAPNAYQNGKIVIALYKYPMTTIINVFVPFYLLSLLSLGVFFQSNDFTGRSIAIFMLLTSYIAMIPGIRGSIPPTPSLILIEIIVYLQTCCIILIFAQSLSIRDIQNYEFIWDQDPYFIIIFSYMAISFLTITGLCLIHKIYWQHQYNRLPEGTYDQIQQKINTDQWYNSSCQNLFKKYYETNKLSFPYQSSLEQYNLRQMYDLSRNNSRRIIVKGGKPKSIKQF